MQETENETGAAPGGASRRALLAAGAAVAVGAAGLGGYAYWRRTLPALSGARRLTPLEAHEAATARALTLVDIRRPDEWAETGLGISAQPLDMREQSFVPELLALVDGDTAAPIALICARGVRSRHLAAALEAAGFTDIHDVPEGMLGSAAGPGWLARGLPVVEWPA